MNGRFDAVDARFDTQANRMELQAAAIQSGLRLLTRMSKWADKSDVSQDVLHRQVADLLKPVQKLENDAAQGGITH